MSPEAEEYAATALKLSREAQAASKAALDISYGSHEEQKIDLYMPDDPSPEPLPVLIFIHGGGWTHGYKDWMGFMAPAITRLLNFSRGFSLTLILSPRRGNYLLLPGGEGRDEGERLAQNHD